MKAKLPIIIVLSVITAGCAKDSGLSSTRDVGRLYTPEQLLAIPDAIPRHEPRTRAGNPDSYVVLGKRYNVLPNSKNFMEKGVASWYGLKFHGQSTSNGEKFDMFAMTAAHKTLPIPSYVRVTNLQNRRSVVVRINDRGPFVDNRIIDLSYTAAVKLGIDKTGTGFVEIRTVEPGSKSTDVLSIQSGDSNPESIFLQIGAFSNQTNAYELSNRISTSRLPKARVQIADFRGNPIYKVQLGPVYSVDEADRLAQDLTDFGIREIHFVVDKATRNVGMLQ